MAVAQGPTRSHHIPIRTNNQWHEDIRKLNRRTSHEAARHGLQTSPDQHEPRRLDQTSHSVNASDQGLVGIRRRESDLGVPEGC